jgi:hypothetical protein
LHLDLRMALECALKAHIACFFTSTLSREEIIRKVESYGHNLTKLASVVNDSVQPACWDEVLSYVEKLEQLPVGLRYGLDGDDFRQANESLYYETVGSDLWLHHLHDTIVKIAGELNQSLVQNSQILSIDEELLQELSQPSHNKYAKPAEKIGKTTNHYINCKE